jgi:hypothetical protein
MADNCMDQRNGWRDPKENGQMLFIIRFLGGHNVLRLRNRSTTVSETTEKSALVIMHPN